MRNKIFGAAVVLVLLLKGTVSMAFVDPENLKARIIHTVENESKVTAPATKSVLPAMPSRGKRFLDAFPPEKIKAIEINADEVTLPTGLLCYCLTKGVFEEITPISVISAPSGKIVLTTGESFHFNVLINPANRVASSINTQVGTMSVPAISQTNQIMSALRVGMTRHEVESKLSADGGLSSPFRVERYVAPQDAHEKDEVLKVNIAFKPAGMSDALYYLGKWSMPKVSPDDTVMRISPFYVERPFFD